MAKAKKERDETTGRFVEGHTHLGPVFGKEAAIARTAENAAYICARIVEGAKLDTIAQELGGKGHSTILMWVAADPAFNEQYRAARMLQADAFAEQVLTIADDGSNDYETRQGRFGDYQAVNVEAVMRSKLRVETRFRLMAAYAPKRYGPKIDHEHSGELTIRTTRYGDSLEVEAIKASYVDVTPTDA